MPQFNVNFNEATKSFKLFDPLFGEEIADVPYGYSWTPIPSEEGCLIPLWSSTLSESHVIRLTVSSDDGDKTVGWLCTVSALTSSQHDFFNNLHFRHAAGHAVQILLEKLDVQLAVGRAEFRSMEAFPEKACVLISLKSRLPQELRVNPAQLLPQLHQYGFAPHKYGSSRTYTAGKHAIANLSPDGRKITSLKLKRGFSNIEFAGFIENLFANPLADKQDSPYRFFLYYQIIELLMEEVQSHRQASIVQSLNDANGDTTVLYELLQKLNEQTSEKSRIVALFHEYTKVSSEILEGLKTECIAFLKTMDRNGDIENCGRAVYKVRNMLIHNMRRVPVQGMESLNLINEYLEVTVPALLLSFTHPAAPIEVAPHDNGVPA